MIHPFIDSACKGWENCILWVPCIMHLQYYSCYEWWWWWWSLGWFRVSKTQQREAHFVHRMVEQEYKHLDKFPFQVQFQFLPPQFIMFNKTMYRCKERPSKMKRDRKISVPAALRKCESCSKLPSSWPQYLHPHNCWRKKPACKPKLHAQWEKIKSCSKFVTKQ